MRADEAALSMPHAPIGSGSVVAIPDVLSPGDVALMRRIFAYQRRGDIPDAIRDTVALHNPLLIGTVLAERYLGRFHVSTIGELSDWMLHYRDLPEAPAIFLLLKERTPKNEPLPPAPDVFVSTQFGQSGLAPEDIDEPRNDVRRNPTLDRIVMAQAGRCAFSGALRSVATARGISVAYAAQLRADVAQAAFVCNDDAMALRIAQAVQLDTAPDDQPSLAFFMGGLAAWRLDRIDTARGLFEAGAKASFTTAHLRAASAFWAARAARRMHDPVGAVKWLRVAAREHLTFHGMLARRILRMPTALLPNGEILSEADVDAVGERPAGERAFALLQVGQPGLAEAELRTLWPQAQSNAVFARSLMMVCATAGLTDLATQLAAAMPDQDGFRADLLRFPLPRLQPAGGFQVDPALVYALTRVESNFDPAAVSAVGARGLMQIMPATAQAVTGEWFAADRLHEPASNLEIGQRYVNWLAHLDGIDGDLMRILASYNAGPGSFLHWAPSIHDEGDPLLFIEAIPVAETRAFIPHALLYSWIYAARLHLPAGSLDALAADEFPRFTPVDSERKMASLVPPG